MEESAKLENTENNENKEFTEFVEKRLEEDKIIECLKSDNEILRSLLNENEKKREEITKHLNVMTNDYFKLREDFNRHDDYRTEYRQRYLNKILQDYTYEKFIETETQFLQYKKRYEEIRRFALCARDKFIIDRNNLRAIEMILGL